MAFFDDMRIRDKVLAGYLVAVLGVLGVAILSWSGMSDSDRRFEAVLQDTVPEVLALEQLRYNATELIRAVDSFASRTAVDKLRGGIGNPGEDNRVQVKIARAAMGAALREFARGQAGDAVVPESLKRNLLATAQEILGYPDRFLARIDADASFDELLQITSAFAKRASEFRSMIDGAIGLQKRALAAGHTEARERTREATWALAIGVSIVLLLTLAGGYFTANRISRPIRQLSASAARIGMGDFTTIAEKATRDEVGELVDAFRQMTDRLRLASEDLRESETKWRSMVSNVPGALYRALVQPQWKDLFMGDSIESITGYRPVELMNNPELSYASLIHPQDRAMTERKVGEAIKQRAPYTVEYRIRHRDGSIRWVYEQGHVVIGENDQVLYSDGIIADSTERKKAELELHEAHEELKAATDKLARQERFATLGQVAATVSHELRNPLGAIRNSMALVRQMTKGANAGVDRALERVDRNIDRCTRIIGDLLEFTHQRELTREPTAIDRWVTEMLDQQPVAEGIALRRELLCGEQVAIDRERFRQVMVNLLDNAAQALSDPAWRAPAGHERIVTVRTETAEPHVRLSVIDTGPGMAADKLPQIFEPLFTTKGFGVGLGLPTARQIIEQHGGTIDVESRVGEGAAFIIWLPRYVAETARGAAAA